MPRSCCIKNCTAQKTTHHNIFKFPTNENERNLWLTATKGYLKKKCKSNNLFICKHHFSEDCFYQGTYKIWKDGYEIDFQRKIQKLKKNIIPTIFEGDPEDSETDSLEIAENIHSETSEIVPLKYTFANSLDVDSNNHSEKIIENKTETNDKNSLNDDCKKSTTEKWQHSKERILENSEKLKHDESQSHLEISTSEFPQFTFADSFEDDLQNIQIKRRKIVSHSSTSDCKKLKETEAQLIISNNSQNDNEECIIIKNENFELQNDNEECMIIRNENSEFHSLTDNSDNSNLITSKLQSTTSVTTFPSFTFANSNTGNYKNNSALLTPEDNEITITKTIINNVVQVNSGINQLQSTNNAGALTIGQNKGVAITPTIKNILNLNTGINQLSPTIASHNGMMFVGQNGYFQPTINNISVSDLSNYTFATRPKPSSPNCTELLILKKLNPVQYQVNNTVPITNNLSLAKDGTINVNINNKLPINNNINLNNKNLPVNGVNAIKISRVHSEASNSKVHSTNECTIQKTNEKEISSKKSLKRVKKKNERDLSPSSLRRVNIVNDILTLNSSIPVNNTQISQCTSVSLQSALSSINVCAEYSKSTLMWDWKHRNVNEFPKYWGMIDSPDGVFFGYVGDIPSCTTRSIYVKEDMTVELRANNRIANCPVIEKIENLEQLRVAMIKIVSMNLCNNTEEGKCQNGFYLRKNGTSSKMCKDCQIKRNKEQSCIRLKSRRMNLKKERRKKNLRNIKQKLSRALKKIEVMQNTHDILTGTLLQENGIIES